MIFLGFMIGSFVSGFIGDRFGRKLPTFISIVFLLMFGVLSIFPQNFPSLVFIRFFYGTAVGIVTPLMSVLMTEISPVHLRGKQLVTLALFWSIGALLACWLASILLDSLDQGNWRGLLAMCCIPIFFSLVSSFIYLEESPRYYLLNKRYQDAFKAIDRMIKMNRGTDPLTSEEKERLEAWSCKQEVLQKQVSSHTSDIFNRTNRKTTFTLWTMWFALSSVYYGIVYVLPTVINSFEKENKNNRSEGFTDMMISVAFELPSCILAYWIIETETFGRKRTMFVSFFFTTLSSFAAFFVSNENFIYLSTAARFFINLGFQIIYPYTAELYPTLLRSRGLGLASAFSRLGGILMPWIILAGYEIRITGPFLLFSFISLLAMIASLIIPHDTTGKELDTYD
jgi:MFS family permease